ncbi:PREDICTED: E3 ubiquitin-protein ligase RNF181-like [Tarenaya hassleriana]|uniref:E3 ubiquitin-protein ligase RNF181-like n=1 Tax=Tarenaya hassleriana TaxID=28532 RepID=UPI00053C2244|nr:PREDICTED: E3 ubiquitin-protein ligase RNF181-like [Tarenaya hassleriana]
MTTVLEPNGIVLDLLFDLDEALAMPIVHRPSTESNAIVLVTDQVVESTLEKMPTVYPDRYACLVCMEYVDPGIGGKRTQCGHVYHSSCIATWLSCSGRSCPLCRQEILLSK